MIIQKNLTVIAGAILISLLLAFGAVAEEALPQMIPVTFPEGRASAVPENAKDNYEPSQGAYSEDGMAYHDDTLDVQLHMIEAYDTSIAVAFVQIATPEQLRTEQAKRYPSKTTVRVSEIAKRVNAVLAVNADWFTYHNSGIVYRNGELLRNRSDEEYDGLAIDINGDFHIIQPMTEEGYAQIATPIANSFVFGPALVIDGQVQDITDRAVTYRQRLAIGQVAPLSYVLVATDGTNEPDSGGLNMPQLAELMHGLGAHTAYNLDGGQSASMLLNEVKVNGDNPKNMRAVGDIIYFTTAIADE